MLVVDNAKALFYNYTKMGGTQMDKNVNAELLKVYEGWEEDLLSKYIDKYTDKGAYNADGGNGKRKKSYEGTQLSCPFYMGLTDDYTNNPCNKKRVMIVGQEPRGYGIYTRDKNEDAFKPKSSQEWAKCYLRRQIGLKDNCGDLNYNASRFWGLFRALKDDYVLCWTDIDKVYYNRDGDYKGTLTSKGEAYLNQRYGDEKKSVLEREIELAKPDYIVFVIGPSYHVSLEQSFGIEEKIAQENTPNIEKKIISISNLLKIDIPAFWTYHPANRRGVNVIELVKEKLSQSDKEYQKCKT